MVIAAITTAELFKQTRESRGGGGPHGRGCVVTDDQKYRHFKLVSRRLAASRYKPQRTARQNLLSTPPKPFPPEAVATGLGFASAAAANELAGERCLVCGLRELKGYEVSRTSVQGLRSWA